MSVVGAGKADVSLVAGGEFEVCSESGVADKSLSPVERTRVNEMEAEIRRLRMENES